MQDGKMFILYKLKNRLQNNKYVWLCQSYSVYLYVYAYKTDINTHIERRMFKSLFHCRTKPKPSGCVMGLIPKDSH